MHDPRVGRFFAEDPLFKEYAYNSPYAFSENVVINAVELEGLEKKDDVIFGTRGKKDGFIVLWNWGDVKKSVTNALNNFNSRRPAPNKNKIRNKSSIGTEIVGKSKDAIGAIQANVPTKDAKIITIHVDDLSILTSSLLTKTPNPKPSTKGEPTYHPNPNNPTSTTGTALGDTKTGLGLVDDVANNKDLNNTNDAFDKTAEATENAVSSKDKIMIKIKKVNFVTSPHGTLGGGASLGVVGMKFEDTLVNPADEKSAKENAQNEVNRVQDSIDTVNENFSKKRR